MPRIKYDYEAERTSHTSVQLTIERWQLRSPRPAVTIRSHVTEIMPRNCMTLNYTGHDLSAADIEEIISEFRKVLKQPAD